MSNKMNRAVARLALLTFLVFAARVAIAKWDAYVPRTLQAVIDANQARVTAEAPHFLAADPYPTKARLVYDGRLQPIPAERYAFLAEYMGTIKGHADWARTFTTEILCREGEARYWIPIQGPLVPRMGKEVAPGDALDVYVTLVGARRKGSEVDWVFTINEFLPVTSAK